MMPDKLFSQSELAQLYDPFDPDRRDLDAYVEILEELGAHSVLDVGCGTGTFALMLAERGFAVTGLDPAKASLDIAKSKPGAEKLRWVLGAAATSVQQSVDAVTMTGNVAQVFLSDEEWLVALQACHRALRAGGYLIFEARDPAAKAWLGWNRDGTYRTASVDGVGEIACWEEVTVVEWPCVTFQTTFVLPGDQTATSTSTLRFRNRENTLEALREAGFNATEVREAPDRPGLEFVFIARRRSAVATRGALTQS